MEHKWISCSGGDVPPNPVFAGNDSDGDTIYVGRVDHCDDYLFAKVIPSKGKAYVSVDGKETEFDSYEALSGLRYKWVPVDHGYVPYAISFEHGADDDIIYAGRGYYKGILSVGYVGPDHDCLYIQNGKEQVQLFEYEVLTQPDQWIDATADSMPEDALEGGRDVNGDPIYVGRVFKDGNFMPAKVIPNKGGAYVSFDGAEHKMDTFQVLTGAGFMWTYCGGGELAPGAVSPGNTNDGEMLYIGRAPHKDSLSIGKIHPSHGCLYLPFGGGEVKLEEYEVLVRS